MLQDATSTFKEVGHSQKAKAADVAQRDRRAARVPEIGNSYDWLKRTFLMRARLSSVPTQGVEKAPKPQNP